MSSDRTVAEFYPRQRRPPHTGSTCGKTRRLYGIVKPQKRLYKYFKRRQRKQDAQRHCSERAYPRTIPELIFYKNSWRDASKSCIKRSDQFRFLPDCRARNDRAHIFPHLEAFSRKRPARVRFSHTGGLCHPFNTGKKSFLRKCPKASA